jgi:hypothetical protein
VKISVRACPSTKYGQLYSRSRKSSDKNLQIVEGSQYLVEVEQALTKIFKWLKAVSIW